MSQSKSPDLSQLLGVGNTTLVVTGLMLPVGGAVSRFVSALFVAGLPNPVQLASTLPPGELATAGAMPVLTVAVFFLGSWLVVRTSLRRGGRARDLISDERLRLGIAVVAGLGVLVIEAPWVGLGSAVTSLVLFLIAAWLGLREGSATDRVAPVRGGRLAISLVAMYGLAAITYGLGGRLGPAGHVSSSDPTLFASDAYIRVGEDSDWLLLAPCSNRGVVLQVPKASIALVRWEPVAIRDDLSETDVYRVCPPQKP